MAVRATLGEQSSVTVADIVFPRWSIPSFQRKSGLYPLGIESVTLNQLAPELSSGLPVLSRHPRYWSIYTYIVKCFWDTKREPQKMAVLGRFLRAREIVFSCASLLCQRHGELPGIIGRDTFMPWLQKHHTDDLPLDMDYLRNRLGGYGQVYRGAMADLGLIMHDNEGRGLPVDAPLGELGAAVANAFAASIAGTEYARHYAERDEGTIPLGVIRELAEASCFCRLAENLQERDLLTDVLLGQRQAPTTVHHNRRETVRLYLDLAEKTAQAPLTEDRFRSLLYYGAVKTADKAIEWPSEAAVEGIRQSWRLVQLREFVVGALNSLFVDFVRWGLGQSGAMNPIPIAAYADRVGGLRLPSEAGSLAGHPTRISLAEVVSMLDAVVEAHGWPVATSAIDAPLSEINLAAGTKRGQSPDTPTLALLTLLLVQRRVAWMRRHGIVDGGESALNTGGLDRLSVDSVVSHLGRAIERGDTLGTAIVDVVRMMVIRQHMRVARDKLQDAMDTFRFRDDGDGLLFIDHRDAGFGPISIRFDAIGTALSGLGLIATPLSHPGHGLTQRGQAVLHG